MKTLAYVACAVLVVGLIALAGCGGEEQGAQAPDTTVIAQKTCPVMAGPINKDIFTEYEGRKIYFCCPACKEAFAKEPAKYVAKVDEELKKLAAPE
ncbi:MAG TPA: YHS domain-containing protein [Planctomycetota bacterium]|nr:YHS domain-containing protein [Planctomycetota bacterium]